MNPLRVALEQLAEQRAAAFGVAGLGSRIAVLMAGCASLMAALSTATGVEGERLRILWTITLGCAILGLAALTAANRWRNPEKPVVWEC